MKNKGGPSIGEGLLLERIWYTKIYHGPHYLLGSTLTGTYDERLQCSSQKYKGLSDRSDLSAYACQSILAYSTLVLGLV